MDRGYRERGYEGKIKDIVALNGRESTGRKSNRIFPDRQADEAAWQWTTGSYSMG